MDVYPLSVPEVSASSIAGNRVWMAIIIAVTFFGISTSVFASPADTTRANEYRIAGESFLAEAKYRDAIPEFEKAVTIYYENEAWEPWFKTKVHGLGVAYYNLVDFETAMAIFEQAVNDAKIVLGINHVLLGEVYNNMGLTSGRLDRFEDEVNYLNKALEIQLNQLGELNYAVATTYNNLGVSYGNRGYNDRQVEYYQKAVSIREQILEPMHPQLGTSYNNLGVSYGQLGNYEKQHEYYLKSLEIRLHNYGENHPDVARAYNNLGFNHGRRGDYVNQIIFYEKALRIRENTLGERHPLVATTHNNISVAYGNFGDHERELHHIKKSLEILLANHGETHSSVANGYNNIANTYEKMGDFNQAEESYRKSIDIYLRLVDPAHPAVARVYANFGNLNRKTGNYDIADEYLKKALDARISRLGDFHPDVARTLVNLSTLYSEKGQTDIALETINKAASAIVEGFQSDGVYDNPELLNISSPDLLLTILINKAGILSSRFESDGNKDNLNHSLETYQLAAKLTDSLRFSLPEDRSLELLAEKAKSVYNGGIKSAFQLHELSGNPEFLETGFSLSEQAKSFALVRAVRNTGRGTFAGVPDSLIQLERELKMNRHFFQSMLQRERESANTEQAEFAFNRMFEEQQKYTNLINRIRTEYPEYYNLRFGNETADLKSVQQQLTDPGTVLISYHAGSDDLFAFVISRDGLQGYHQSVTPDQEILIDQFRKSLTDYPFITQWPEESDSLFAYSAHELYRYLLEKPLKNQVKKPERLLVIPDGFLHYINFNVLLSEKPASHGFQYNTLDYLINDYTISYGHSATTLMQQYNRKIPKRVNSRNSVAAFAPGYLISEQPDRMLTGLPGSVHEASLIGSLTGGRILTEAEATLDNLRLAAEEYRILHLAMHGLIDDEKPENSGLIFADTGNPEVDFLKVSDIYNLTLASELVVLSACNTGLGRLVSGEGLMSMSRAFQYAGAPGLILSLWSVPDESTGDIMVRFYRNLQKGLGKDAALRQAKLEYLSEMNDPLHSHPYFWAGFVATGNMNPVFRKSVVSNPIVWVFVVGIVVAIPMGIRLYKREKR